MHRTKLLVWFLTLTLMISISACAGAPEDDATSTVAAVATATVMPSPTPTVGPGEVLLHSSAQVDVSAASEIENLLRLLAEANGLVLKQTEADLRSGISTTTRLVITLIEDDAIEELAAKNPEIGFIVAGRILEAPDNVYSVGTHRGRYNQSGFLAGYVAALITPDYRVGGIAIENDGEENAALQGFLNGVVFHCGLCRPAYPPFNSYPQAQFVSSSDPAAVQTAVQALKDLGVTTVYLSPGLNSPPVFETLQNTGIRLLGSGVPENPSGYTWVATVRPDLLAGIQQAWEAWLLGQVVEVIEPEIMISNVDAETLSPGKVEHIEGVIDDLASGRIEPGVDPLTGDAR